MRLHTPRVPLSSLSGNGGNDRGAEGCLLLPIRNALDAVDAAARAVERAREEDALLHGGEFWEGGESSSEEDDDYDDE